MSVPKREVELLSVYTCSSEFREKKSACACVCVLEIKRVLVCVCVCV